MIPQSKDKMGPKPLTAADLRRAYVELKAVPQMTPIEILQSLVKGYRKCFGGKHAK